MRKDYDFDEDGPYVVVEKNSGSLSSFMIGLAIGAGVALLFAPQSGEETRAGIRRKARQARDAAQDAVTGAADKVVGTFDEARQRVEDQIDRARQAVIDRKEQVSRAVRAGRMAARQARGDIEGRIAEAKMAYQNGDSPRRATMPDESMEDEFDGV
jgi:gas vesicle protein